MASELTDLERAVLDAAVGWIEACDAERYNAMDVVAHARARLIETSRAYHAARKAKREEADRG